MDRLIDGWMGAWVGEWMGRSTSGRARGQIGILDTPSEYIRISTSYKLQS